MSRPLYIIFVALAVFTSHTYEEENGSLTWKPCSPYCQCARLLENDTKAKCNLTGNGNLCDIFVLPNDTTALDLSENHLPKVPTCVLAIDQSKNITSLSLADNEITVIEEGSFPRMPYLEYLDISFNQLLEWKGDILATLPFLVSIDLTGNHFFIPDEKFFSLESLVAIQGIKWSNSCGECILLKNELLINVTDELCVLESEEILFADEIQYGMSVWFFGRGFTPQCLCEQSSCYSDEISKPYDLALNTLPRNLFYIEYVLGAIACVVNVMVVFITFNSRQLRNNTSFILIGNIAMCDVIMGVYSVLIGRYTVYEFIVNEEGYPGMDLFINNYCTVMGVIFTTAQITAVTSSFLATLEKYLAILYCMNPNIRLRKKPILVTLVAVWIVAIGYALLGAFQVGGLRYHGEFTCMMPFVDGPSQFDVSVAGFIIAAFLVLLYIISIALYIHIFVHVRRAGVSAGVKRKAALAKNISVMVFTNFLFFILPMVSTLLFVYQFDRLIDALDITSLSALRSFFITFSWLPVVLLSFNSCLNPFLCAFRHPKVREEIRKCFSRCDCSTLGGSRKQFHHAWVLSPTKRFVLTSTDASGPDYPERFRRFTEAL